MLIDRHHHALFHSLQMLFEDRLGYIVYTPVGHEWWDKGYWRFGEGYGDDRLAQQFLTLDRSGEWKPINDQSPGYRTFTGRDNHHPEREILGVELGAVLATPHEWAYVVASVQDNQQGFARLAAEIGAQYVLQVGNTNQYVDWSLDPLALVSSEVPIRGRGVVYHQEFDAKGVFGYREPQDLRTVRSFVNCFRDDDSKHAGHYCWLRWEETRMLLPEFTFSSHGIDGPDGNVETVAEIADLMAGSAWGWHDKVQGDGFGHVIHDWAAIGRPLIGHGSHYRGLMAEPFWQDGITCIDLDRNTPDYVALRLRTITPEEHAQMCRNIRAVFDDIVDYDAEADSIRALLA